MRKATWVVTAVMSFGLAACAGVGSNKHSVLPSENYDAQKVELVNRWALDHGARVIWVNYPTKAHPESTNGS
jgi:hypothetical protein